MKVFIFHFTGSVSDYKHNAAHFSFLKYKLCMLSSKLSTISKMIGSTREAIDLHCLEFLYSSDKSEFLEVI